MDNIDENAINIYTDGSSFSGPRAGGIGIRYVTIDDNGEEAIVDEPSWGYKGATSQQMELQACIEALRLLTSRRPPVDPTGFASIIINTDSRYVVDNFDNAKFRWPTTRWHGKDGAPILNAQLWKDLVKEVQRLRIPVRIHWVKGHKSSAHNKAADKLARASAKHGGRGPLTVVSVRRKETSKSVEIGCVELTGQRLTIRVITNEYLRVQRCYKLKYEVMSKASPFYGNVDIVFSDAVLKDGHTYRVRMNNDSKNPRIAKYFGEVDTKSVASKEQ